MQSELLIFLLLIWSAAVNCAPADGSSTNPFSLGDKVLKKQEECEGIISDIIDEILDDEDSDVHDFPVPDDSYYDCKEALDKMKREYMSVNRIQKSTYPEFFPLRLSDGTLEIISVPDEESEERKELEFDVNEELCVTSRKCGKLLDLIDGDKEKEKIYNERYGHCRVLLNDVKLKYIHEKELDENKLKEEEGLSVMCTGRSILLPLPHAMNNLDYHESHDELPLGDQPASPTGEETSPGGKSPSDDHQEAHIHTLEDGKHKDHVENAKETPELVHRSSSNALVEKANLIYCVLVIYALVTLV